MSERRVSDEALRVILEVGSAERRTRWMAADLLDARSENTKLLAVVEAAEALYTPYPAETPIAARPTTLLRAALDALATGKESE